MISLVAIVIVYFVDIVYMGVADMKHNLTFEELCELVAPIAERRGVDKIYLFGSRARDDGDDDSDYDFYIIAEQIKSLMGLSGLMQDLEDALGSKVDIVAEDPYIKEDFLKEVLRDRRLVYEA